MAACENGDWGIIWYECIVLQNNETWNKNRKKCEYVKNIKGISRRFAFFIDSYYIKKNKEYEIEIYKAKVEDLKNKKRQTEIRGEVLPDYVLNKKIDIPTEEVALPIAYYIIMLVIGIIIRITIIH